MKDVRRWTLAGTVIVANLGVMAVNASDGSDGRPNQASRAFVRLGPYYLNANQVDYAVVDRAGTEISFAVGSGDRLVLTGADATWAKRWLNEHTLNSRDTVGDPPQMRPGQTPVSPGNKDGERAGAGQGNSGFVRTKSHWLNTVRIVYMRESEDGLHVAFERREQLVFGGTDADILRRELGGRPIEGGTPANQQPSPPESRQISNEGFRNYEKRHRKPEE